MVFPWEWENSAPVWIWLKYCWVKKLIVKFLFKIPSSILQSMPHGSLILLQDSIQTPSCRGWKAPSSQSQNPTWWSTCSLPATEAQKVLLLSFPFQVFVFYQLRRSWAGSWQPSRRLPRTSWCENICYFQSVKVSSGMGQSKVFKRYSYKTFP